ncbi:uncharacterized protein LOC131675164 [Phymastichus coffea]|uniref:uncharacterized protein LOC131675164 n=1 Tax=Phymastichus coffea TaxID=108790 RepID=UPI00273BD2BE|nr:uncharacterized protein LOC131675164 [Phymastichus coffea]
MFVTNINSWLNKIFWKRWKYLLSIAAIIFVFLQIGNMSILGFVNESPNSNTRLSKHLQHVSIKKVLSKWTEPQHSKIIKDPEGHAISLRGTHDKDIIKYSPNSEGKFTCFSTKEEIDFIRVNDDYCDCVLDGSDEPGTNACNNGIFYCEKTIHKFPASISSYKVNDGICDCCDGSDEWQEISVLDSSDVSENHPLQYRLTQCQNHCKNVI